MKLTILKNALIILHIAPAYCAELSFTIINQTEYKLLNADTKVAYFFAHGLGATGLQANMYTKKFSNNPYPDTPYWILANPLITFNFLDAKNDKAEWESDKVNLGQQLDMNSLTQAYQATREHFPDHEIVMFGVSRGATTICNALAHTHFENLRAVVLESPFDTIKNVVNHLIDQYLKVGAWIPFVGNIGMAIMQKKFPSLDMNGIFPIKVVKNIPSDLPILLIHSRKDRVIPPNSVRLLYKELIETGHKHIYYLELARGEHARLMCGPEAELYQTVVHAFYKKYNLPYAGEYVVNADNILSHCQPSIADIDKLMLQRRSVASEEII